MSSDTHVAIVGAGPYGLSLAAHLQRSAVEHQIVGLPMQFWSAHMPRGMQLKSEGFASNLYDPDQHYTLRRFCEAEGIAYADVGLPVGLETFWTYGLAFQRRYAAAVEKTLVASVRAASPGFRLELANGATLNARKVVIASGILQYAHTPATLAGLPEARISHSSAHSDLSGFAGQAVAVLGGGASAIDVAALLSDQQARVQLIARKPVVKLHGRMQLPRPFTHRLQHPLSPIGPGWRSLFYSKLPSLFLHLPASVRGRIVDTHLGPAGGWFMKDALAKVELMLGYELAHADMHKDRVRLTLTADNGKETQIEADHVIAATGFKVDVRRLSFLASDLQSRLRLWRGAPVLSSQFESSVPGLFFVGAAAAASFGPLMRFACGAEFSAARLGRVLAGKASS